ncbi:MAG: peptidoglycan DD-metalloendopeptidase family protein [Alphaproteobacteria bacterium]
MSTAIYSILKNISFYKFGFVKATRILPTASATALLVCGATQSLHAQAATFSVGDLPGALVNEFAQQSYTVKSGDTLFKISRDFGVDARVLASANNLGSGNIIYIGQQLVIPGGQAQSGQVNAFPPAQPSPTQPSPTTPVFSQPSNNGSFDPYAASGIVAPNVPTPLPLPVQPTAPRQPILLPSGGNSNAFNQPTIGNAQQAAGRKVMHVVRPGDTLAGIAGRYGVDPRGIIEENRLAIPIQIYVDQALFIPGVGANAASQISATNIATQPVQPSLVPTTPAAAIPSLSSGGQNTVTALPVPLGSTTTVTQPPATAASLRPVPPKPVSKPRLVTSVVPRQQTQPATQTTSIVASPEPTQPVRPVLPSPTQTNSQTTTTKLATTTTTASSNNSALADPPPDRTQRFAWPARGRLLSSFGTKIDGLVNDGVNIAVDVGTEVRAADDGTVAYAGDALKGFGNLLLVKHADNWITAYANNSTLKVAKGDKIKRGQLIALSGQTGNASQPQLHFEVRQNGRAVDPLNYLSN